MSDSLVCTFTDVGLAALVKAQGDGLQATIAYLAVGRGVASGAGFAGYTPNRTATGLRNETVRVPLLSGEKLSASAGFRVLAQVPASSLPAEYWIQEVAALLSDGTPLAIWSDPLRPLAGKTGTTDVDLSYDLLLEGIPPGLLTITVLEPDIPDTTVVLATMLRSIARLTTQQILTNERLIGRGIY